MNHVVVVPGTYWKDVPAWLASYAPENRPMRSIAEIFGCTPRLFDWSGANSAPERHAAASSLAALLDKLECAHVVGFSHGGNVACEAAAQTQRAVVDTLVTIATPYTGKYRTGGARRHVHLYSEQDRIQILGGEGRLGFPAPAARIFPGAQNIRIQGIASADIAGSHGNILWSDQTWAKLAEAF